MAIRADQNYEPETKNNNAEILSTQSYADFVTSSKYKKTNFDFLELITGQTRLETASKEARIFADIDYAILGDMYNYGTYAMQIRRKYKQFNDDEFRKERIDFIESLLKRQRISQNITKPGKSGFCYMAESTGLEPVERKPVHGLAIRCITTLPTFHRSTKLYVYYLSPSVNIFF